MAKLSPSQFKFKKHETIGAEGAEEDSDYVTECFCDTGDLNVLCDTRQPQRIVVGRTGAGKTALLLNLLEREKNVTWLEPEELALQYLSNSTILQHLEVLGVDLDVFYRYLWRHIMVVELIKLKYPVKNEKDQNNMFAKITALFGEDKGKREALDYLSEWGNKFWLETDARVKEITKKFEDEIQAEFGGSYGGFKAGASGKTATSVEERMELAQRAQKVVHSVQIVKLARVMDILADDVLKDPQSRYFIVIDKLDEKWVHSTLRYRLIRALIETIRDFKKITNAKIVIALRQDLLARVIRQTRDEGFQQEKYQPLYLRLLWNAESLKRLTEKRLNRLVACQYTGAAVRWDDIFPVKIGRQDSFDWVVNRSMYRPRDLIRFVNCCMTLAVGKPEVTKAMMKTAENTYSRERLDSVCDEWAADYPNLVKCVKILRGRPRGFALGYVNDSDVEDICIDIMDKDSETTVLEDWARKVLDGRADISEFKIRVFRELHKTGVIGVKTSASQSTSWAFQEQDPISQAEFDDETRIVICPMFWRALGVDPRIGAEA